MKKTKMYQVEVLEQDNDLVIEFPEEIVEEQGWLVGDTLEWIIHDDYVILRKKPDENSST
jgi:bifunctional DNA-binding transcriptional regulator/antitoxin component of YhaV-PrlF toxin-antitoxin module